MFSLSSSHRYLLYRQPCDMRKSFDSLSGVVSGELGRNPLSGEVFIFLNKRHSHMKMLHWENGGFVLYYKRLEKGTFSPPETKEDGSVSWPELVLMIEGIKVQKIIQKRRFSIEKND